MIHESIWVCEKADWGGVGVKIEKFFMRLDVPWESFTQVFSLMI